MGKLFFIVALFGAGLASGAFGAGLASGAAAQTACGAARPAAGTVLHGPVLAIPDTSTLCVATGTSPAQWTAVSLPALNTSRAVLMAAAFGQNATCVIGADGIGDCRIEDAPLAAEIRRPEIVKAAIQWRDRPAEAAGPTQLASNDR